MSQEAQDALVNEWQSFSGLSLKVDEDGKLAYDVDEDGKAMISRDARGKKIGSRRARRLIIRAIDQDATINIMGTMHDPVTSFDVFDWDAGDYGVLIGLNYEMSKSLERNFTGKGGGLTVGHGMIGLHELYHGAALKFDGKGGWHKGPAVRYVNGIRRQLNMATRKHYSPYHERTLFFSNSSKFNAKYPVFQVVLGLYRMCNSLHNEWYWYSSPVGGKTHFDLETVIPAPSIPDPDSNRPRGM